MKADISKDQWVWVVIQDPGEKELFLGQHDEEKGISYIPIFLEKEAAGKGINFLAKEEGHKYEIQAIQYGHLLTDAVKAGFNILLMDDSGNRVEI